MSSTPKFASTRPESPKFAQAIEVAEHRPNEGSWQSPLAKPMTHYPMPMAHVDSLQSLGEFYLDVQDGDDKVAALDLDKPFYAEQISGHAKLPAPLSTLDRERTLRTLTPTATFQMLAQIPSDLVETEGPEGQELRTRLLHGATVLFFCAGYRGKKFVFEKAAQLGVKAVVIDGHESWAKEMVAEGIIAKFIGVDMGADSEHVFQEALAGIRSLADDESLGGVDGICTFVELAVPMVARLAEAQGLPGPKPEAVDKARDKHRTRETMSQAGLPSIANFLIENEADLDEAASIVGFPAVLKPISGAASLGVQKVETHEDLLTTYREVIKVMSNLHVTAGNLERKIENSLDDDSIPAAGVDADKVITLDMMLEEYLDGEEVDIDVIFSGGECRYCEVSDNGPTLEPYFGETWGCLPSLLPEEKKSALTEMAISSVKALGFDTGVFHVEGKYTSRGPRLIEVNARMGGGPVRTIHKRIFHVDLVVEQLFLACGIPSRPMPNYSGLHIAYGFTNAAMSGAVDDITFVEKYRDVPNTEQVLCLVHPGEHFVGPEDGQPTWLAEIVVCMENGQEAVAQVQRMCEDISQDFKARSAQMPCSLPSLAH